MVYDPLLLSFDGGITDDAARAPLDPNRARLVIGIGGNGIDALCGFKGKLLTQLLPDDPQADMPQYRGIPLLGIDSDPDALRRQRGNNRLTDSEFFCMQVHDLQQQLLQRRSVTNDPYLSWMDVEHAGLTQAPQSLGGIRQVGRFLLTRHAPALVNRLTGLILDAMGHVGTNNVDVFVLAGLGGGTGSGCFLDVCYLLRRIAHVHGIQLTIHGYFFLPEVVYSQVPLRHDANSVHYMEANGYAALKELDYLMDLRERSDVFCHTYGPGLQVDTQEPPVDCCCLLGATRDGAMVPDAYGYACETAAEHILAAITDCTHPANAMPMVNHQADTANALANQPRLSGCRQHYRAIGVSTARIPRTELFTYLTCGFFDRFNQAVGPDVHPVDKKAVEEFARNWKLTPDDVLHRLDDRLPLLTLPEVNIRQLSRAPRPDPGRAPVEWEIAGNDWLERCKQEISKNAKALTEYPTDFAPDRMHEESLTHRIFRRLCELCADPSAGPWFAAKLLRNEHNDLVTMFNMAIRFCEDRLETENMYLHDSTQGLEAAKNDFCGRLFPSGRAYQAYQQITGSIFLHRLRIHLLTTGIDMLQTLLDQLKQLHTDFFRPLVELLDDLSETFRENDHYLHMGPHTGVAHFLLELPDIRQLCDPLIQGLNLDTTIPDFMGTLLRNHTLWLRDDKSAFIRLLRRHMVGLFPEVDHMSMEDHLYKLFPQAQGIPGILQSTLYPSLATPEYHRAMPLVSFDHQFPAHHPVRLTVSDVPLGVMPVYGACNDLHLNLPPDLLPLIRQTPNRFCIRTVNTFAGLPLFSLASLQRMQNCYLNSLGREWGLHLYSPTGRGPGDNGRKDWSKLPDPFPGSLLPQLQPLAREAEDLYDLAEHTHLISRDPATGRDVLLRLPPVPENITDPELPEALPPEALAQMLDQLNRLEAQLRNTADPIFLPYRDPDPMQQRRLNIDHLSLSPVLQALIKTQLEALHKIALSREQLEAILADNRQASVDLELFGQCLCCGIVDEPADPIFALAYPRAVYLHPEGLAPMALTGNADPPDKLRFLLYTAFESFRKAVADPTLRDILTRQTQEILASPNGVDRQRIQRLHELLLNQLQTDLTGTGKEPTPRIREFYHCLHDILNDCMGTGSLPLPPVPPAMPVPPVLPDLYVASPDENGAIRVMDPEDGAFLAVYPDRDPHTAVDPASDHTRPVRPDMMVWGNGNWFQAVHCKLLFP